MYSYCTFIYLHRASWHSSATLPEVYLCFFLSYKTNVGVKPAKTGHGPHSSKIYVLFYVMFFFCVILCIVCVCVCVCRCVLCCCHRVTNQLQLTNISYHITYMENTSWVIKCVVGRSTKH